MKQIKNYVQGFIFFTLISFMGFLSGIMSSPGTAGASVSCENEFCDIGTDRCSAHFNWECQEITTGGKCTGSSECC